MLFWVSMSGLDGRSALVPRRKETIESTLEEKKEKKPKAQKSIGNDSLV